MSDEPRCATCGDRRYIYGWDFARMIHFTKACPDCGVLVCATCGEEFRPGSGYPCLTE